MRAADLAGESILIAAGGRSILLQLAEPGIGHGVADHSDFVSRPLDRLNGTLSFVYAVACGTPAEAAHATARVNHAHVPVRSAGSQTAPAYSAFNPALQLWVAATLYDSAVTMYELIYGHLSDALADEMYERYKGLGTALQVPRELWPATRADFAVYWQARLGELRSDRVTRTVAHQLLHPRGGPIWLRLAMPLGRLITVGLLPASVRVLFELPWTQRSQRRYERLLRILRVLYPLLPRRLRHLPKNRYLRSLRASMAAA
ncbi:MAG: oxygenase MpaB family protein [Cryobacterium sp.]